MGSIVPVVAIGPLIRDIIYIKNKGDGEMYLVGSRGGGSIWNTLANVAAKDIPALALCVGGADIAAELCLDELRIAGVTIAKKRLIPGKATRTIHEILSYGGFSQINPKHRCSSVCPVCSSKTYGKGTARLSSSLVMDFAPELKKISSNGMILHIDNFNMSRLNLIRPLKGPRVLLTLDIGRMSSFWRMSKDDIIYNLKEIDILFINSMLLQKMKQIFAIESEEDFLGKVGVRLLISLDGENGIKVWIKSNGEVLSFTQLAAETSSLLDTSGAGDAFIGFLLSRISLISIRDFQDWLENKEEIEQALWESQKWAARKCGYLGPRGHIIDKKNLKWDRQYIDSESKTMRSIECLRFQNEGLSKCSICNFPFNSKSPIDRSKISINVLRFHQNVLSLPKSIEKSWSHRYETPWKELLDLSGPGYVVGTGGSFVAATFIAQLISKHHNNIVMPIRPYDFIRMGLRAPFAVFISNSGKTPDILSAILHAQNINIPKVILISGNGSSETMNILRENKDILLSTGANEDRGFLSVLGVISPCYLSWALANEIWSNDQGYRYFNDLYMRAEMKVNNSFSAFKRDDDFKILGRKSIILGGGFAWPAMLNLESKMVESNFGRPQISEIKDYSHGRFVSSMDQKVIAVVCGMPEDIDYRKFLVKRLREKNHVIEITSAENGSLGSLDLLLQTEHLMKSFAEKENVDISKPRIPRRGLELYKYKNITL